MRTLFIHFHQNFNRVFIARLIEWEHAITLFVFGLILLFNPSIFEGDSYVSFLRIWDSADGWAFLCMLVGGLRFVVLLINGGIRRSPHLRATFACLSAFVWMQVSLGFLAAGNFSTALAVYPGFIFWEFVIFVITVRYAKITDMETKADAPDHHS